MNYIKDFIRRHRIAIIFSIFFVFVLLEHQFIWIHHDDYAYASLSYVDIGNVGSHYSFFKLFDFLGVHYLKWGGRILSIFFECFLLRVGLPFYRFIQSIIITFIFYFIYKIVYPKVKIKDYQLCLIVISMYGFLDIMLLRNSIFWPSAAVSYLFPLLPFLSMVFFLENKEPFKIIIILTSILAFVSSFSQEQVGFMVICYLIMFCWNKFKKDNKKIYFYVLFFSILGFGLLMLAPGNFVRLDTSSSFTAASFLEKFIITIPNVINGIFANYNNSILTLLFISVFAISLFNLIKQTNIFIKLFSLSNFFITIFSVLHQNQNYFNYLISLSSKRIFVIIIYFIFILQILAMIISICYYLYHKKTPFCRLFLSSVASLIVMLVAPYFPPRSVLPFFIVSFVLISYVLGNVLFLVKNNSNYIILVLISFSFLNYFVIVKGYYNNNFINQYNDEQLLIASQKIKSGETIDNIKLKKLIDPTYGGDMPYYENREYILTWIKNYYSIPQEVIIIYE